MKEIALALKDSIERRIKNQVIASIIMAWFFLHWRGVATFALSTNKEMIEIINAYKFDWLHDVIIPSAWGLAFITVGQILIYIPAHFADWISIQITKCSSKNAVVKFKSQRKLNRIGILSEYEYQKILKLKKLEDASSKLEQVMKDYSLAQSNLEHLRASDLEKAERIKKLDEQLLSLNGDADRKYTTFIFSLSQLKDSVQYSLTMLDKIYDSTSDSKNMDVIKEASDVLRDALTRTPETKPLNANQTEGARRRLSLQIPT